MGGTAGGKLAAAVSEAGGLGLIGGGRSDAEWLGREFVAAGNQRIGCGFITWGLAQQPELLDRALTHAPVAIMLSFGDASPFIARIKSAGIPVICQIQSLAQARQVLQEGADIIVAQGSEAAGHLRTVPLCHWSRRGGGCGDGFAAGIPVVAAGGIADGRGLAAALMLGAAGVLIATRFHAAEESLLPRAAKHRIVSGSGTTRCARRSSPSLSGASVRRSIPAAYFRTASAKSGGAGRRRSPRTLASLPFTPKLEQQTISDTPLFTQAKGSTCSTPSSRRARLSRVVGEAEAALTRRFS